MKTELSLKIDSPENRILKAVALVESTFKLIGLPAQAEMMKNAMISYYKAGNLVNFAAEYLRCKYLYPTAWHTKNFVSQILYEISVLPLFPKEKAAVAASLIPDLEHAPYGLVLENLFSYNFPTAKALYIETFSMGYSNCIIRILEKSEPNRDFTNAFLKVTSRADQVEMQDWTCYPYTDSKAIYCILRKYLTDHNVSPLSNNLTNVIEVFQDMKPEYSTGSTCMHTDTYIKTAIIL